MLPSCVPLLQIEEAEEDEEEEEALCVSILLACRVHEELLNAVKYMTRQSSVMKTV